MSGIASFQLAALDCPDGLELARFYGALTGWELREGSDSGWAQLVSPSGATLAFQGVEGYVAPTWPTGDRPQQLHLDFEVADLDEGEAAVLAIGARKAEAQPGGTW